MKCKVLHLLRHDVKMWWWFQTLRQQSRTTEAIKLEQESIRDKVHSIRKNLFRVKEIHFTKAYIEFYTHRELGLDPPTLGETVSMSNVHTGDLAVWVYLYAKGTDYAKGIYAKGMK